MESGVSTVSGPAPTKGRIHPIYLSILAAIVASVLPFGLAWLRFLGGILISTGGGFSRTLSPPARTASLLAEDEAGNTYTGVLEVCYRPSVSAPGAPSPAPPLFFMLAAVLLIACSALFVHRLRH
jgi:hypothetical protein